MAASIYWNSQVSSVRGADGNGPEPLSQCSAAAAPWTRADAALHSPYSHPAPKIHLEYYLFIFSRNVNI